MKCQFCGSETIKVKTPYISIPKRGGKADEYQSEYTFCCQAQKKNAGYIARRFDPSRGDLPDPDEVARW